MSDIPRNGSSLVDARDMSGAWESAVASTGICRKDEGERKWPSIEDNWPVKCGPSQESPALTDRDC